jgi:hypothetical protein
VTIRELAEDYLNDYRVNRRKSVDKAERMVRRVDEDGKEKDSALMAYFGDCKAHGVGTDAVKKYIAQRLETGAANATVNRELAALKRMYTLGIQAERIYRKPHIPMLQEDNVRKGFFEHGEFVAFRNALPNYFKPVVTFAYYTLAQARNSFAKMEPCKFERAHGTLGSGNHKKRRWPASNS